jgi:hypothetical protein
MELYPSNKEGLEYFEEFLENGSSRNHSEGLSKVFAEMNCHKNNHVYTRNHLCECSGSCMMISSGKEF